jgi:ATP-dependent DNA helicase RecG
MAGMILDRAELYGPIDKLIEEAALFVGRNMRVAAPITKLYREDIPEYPLVAVREAISNAVAHRDYSINGQKINLRMFDDHLEVESPGGLVGPVTLLNLGQKRYSRNPLLTRLMYEFGLVEEMGTGIRRMRQTLSDLGSDPPTFEADNDSFTAKLPAKPLPKDASETKTDADNTQTGTVVSEAVTIPFFEINETNHAEYLKLLKSGLNERQARGLLYARERGRLTNKDYRLVNPDITDETARLDMLIMVDKGLLLRIGDKKGASYLPRD